MDIFTGDQHELDDKEFKMFPLHCTRGTSKVPIIKELWDSAQNKKIFYKTNLDKEIAALQPEIIEIVGVCTNVCGFFTGEELHNRDYQVHVLKDGVTSFDLIALQYALQRMSSVLGAKVNSFILDFSI